MRKADNHNPSLHRKEKIKMKRRLHIRSAAFRLTVAAACLSPLLAQVPCSRTKLGLTATITSSSTAPVYTLKGKLAPIISGTDPLGLNGKAGSASITYNPAATPIVSTASSATYSIAAGGISATLGALTFTNTAPWNMTIKLGATADTLTASGPGPAGTSVTLTAHMKADSWTSAVLINPMPFNPPVQKLTQPKSTLAYAVGCIVGVAAGSDYFTTGTGTALTIMSKAIPLTGVPIDPNNLGNTDTIVQRMGDAVFTADLSGSATPDTPSVTIPITVSALQLTGTFGSGTSACTMNITIQASPASSGTMTLMVTTPTGGTYTANLDIYYVVTFTPTATNTLGCPPTMTNNHKLSLTEKIPGGWSTTPIANEVIVPGAYPDPNANQHSGLPPGYVDFFTSGLSKHIGVTIKHFVCESVTSATSTPCQ
jgi:hypothetical protein